MVKRYKYKNDVNSLYGRYVTMKLRKEEDEMIKFLIGFILGIFIICCLNISKRGN